MSSGGTRNSVVPSSFSCYQNYPYDPKQNNAERQRKSWSDEDWLHEERDDRLSNSLCQGTLVQVAKIVLLKLIPSVSIAHAECDIHESDNPSGNKTDSSLSQLRFLQWNCTSTHRCQSTPDYTRSLPINVVRGV